MLFRSPEHINLSVSFFKRKAYQQNLPLKSKTPNKTRSFLDIQIKRSNSSFSTSVYQKPTFTGLFTHFHSFIPLKYKKGLILTLFDRFSKICSTYENFHLEVELSLSLTAILLVFGINASNYFKTKLNNFKTKLIYFGLPFTGLHSPEILVQIHKLYSSAFSHIDFRTVS